MISLHFLNECVFNRQSFGLWDLSTGPPEFLLVAKGQTEVLGWHGGHGKQQVQLGVDFFPEIEPRTINEMYVKLTFTGLTQETFVMESMQMAIMISVNSYIHHPLENMVQTFDGTDTVTLLGSVHTSEWRRDNINEINSTSFNLYNFCQNHWELRCRC